MNLKRLMSLMVVGSMLFFVGCDNKTTNTDAIEKTNADIQAPDTKADAEIPNVVATVNGVEIYKDAYVKSFNQVKNEYAKNGVDFSSDEGLLILSQIQDSAITSLIQKEVLLQATAKAGIRASEEEAQLEIEKIRSNYTSQEDFDKVLVNNGLTEADLLGAFVDEMSIEAYLNTQIEIEAVSDADALKHYNEEVKRLKDSGQIDEIADFNDVKEPLKDQMFKAIRQEQMLNVINMLVEGSDVEIHL